MRAAGLILLALTLAWPLPGSGPRTRPEAIPLWPRGAPGALGTAPEDVPALYAFPAGRPNGAAAVVCPGGAYGMLALETEGFEVAEWLNSLGISAFVLRYRLAPRYRHPAPAADGKRAMRWVRANAGRYRIDPLRIGMVGFSAGGHLAATVATRYDGGRAAPDDSVDRYPCQPAFQALVYPVITMRREFTHPGSRRNLLGEGADSALVDLLSNELHAGSHAPPAFLVHARTDPVVPFRNSQAYHEALRRAGAASELHAYARGGHAFGLARVAARGEPAGWPELCALWLARQGMIPAGPGPARSPSARSRGQGP